MCVCKYPKRTEISDPFGAGVTRGCKPLNMVAGTRTRGLLVCESSLQPLWYYSVLFAALLFRIFAAIFIYEIILQIFYAYVVIVHDWYSSCEKIPAAMALAYSLRVYSVMLESPRGRSLRPLVPYIGCIAGSWVMIICV